MDSLERAVDLAPAGVAWPRLNRGGVKLMVGDIDGAIADFEATGVATSDPEVASNMATAYYFAGRLEDAVRLYERAVELDPGGHVWRRNLGDALLALGRTPEAREAFGEAYRLAEEAVARRPRDNVLLSARALYAAKMGTCERAVPLAAETRDLLTGGWSDHLHLAMTFALCGERDQAMAEARLAVEGGLPASALAQQAELEALAGDPDFAALIDPGS
jgi:tetratricopeptide (TPR) repeat protein